MQGVVELWQPAARPAPFMEASMRRAHLLAMLALFGLIGAQPARAVLHAGDVAPNFTKLDLNGVPHTLYDYRGKVVLLFLLGYG